MNAQLTTLDVLYISLSLGFLVLVGFVSFTSLKLARTLDSLKLLIDDIDDAANDVKNLKNQLKAGALSATSLILGLLSRKGRR